MKSIDDNKRGAYGPIERVNNILRYRAKRLDVKPKLKSKWNKKQD